jgi:RNA polymerase sigma-70 factor (ECF subfamily)
LAKLIGAGVTVGGIDVSDQDAFALGLEPLLPVAFRLAYAMLRHRDDAEDAVQEAAARAWHKRWTFRAGSELRPWFLAIVANECRMALRRRRRVMPEPSIAVLEESEEVTSLRRALARLDENTRLVLVLRYYLDLPFEEVARTLGISAGAARVRVHRALARLRPVIEVEEGLRDA